jgi:hypothetical protein
MPSKAEVAAKREKVARGMAMGLSASAAGVAAGYKSDSGPCEIAKTDGFEERVTELKELLLWTGSFEPAPLIMELLETARKAAGLGSGASMNAAATMYAEIGRLTSKLASRPAGRDDDEMTDTEWLEAHGPPS